MKKALEVDVTGLGDILEGIVMFMDNGKINEPDLIDLAARLKPAAKACEAIDKHVKEMVKAKLKHKEGNRLGGMFKAILKLVPTKRLNQGKLKADDPELYEAYCEDEEQERVTFEVR